MPTKAWCSLQFQSHYVQIFTTGGTRLWTVQLRNLGPTAPLQRNFTLSLLGAEPFPAIVPWLKKKSISMVFSLFISLWHFSRKTIALHIFGVHLLFFGIWNGKAPIFRYSVEEAKGTWKLTPNGIRHEYGHFPRDSSTIWRIAEQFCRGNTYCTIAFQYLPHKNSAQPRIPRNPQSLNIFRVALDKLSIMFKNYLNP